MSREIQKTSDLDDDADDTVVDALSSASRRRQRSSSHWAHTYVSLIRMRVVRWTIILVWVGVLACSAYYGPMFLALTNAAFSAPRGSTAYRSQQRFQQFFPSRGQSSDLGLFIKKRSNEQCLLGPRLRQFQLELNATIRHYPHKHSQCHASKCVLMFTSYYMLEAANVPPEAAQALLAPRGCFSKSNDTCEATLAAVSVNIPFSSNNAISFALFLEAQVAELQLKHNLTGLRMGWEGIPAFMPQMLSLIEKDMGTTDAVVLPIAFLFLAYGFKSFRLLILPLLCIPIALLGSFALMTGVASHIEVISFLPSLMMTISIAMGVDYSLFIISRYRKGLLSGKSSFDALVAAVEHGVFVVLVSGVTLSLCFAGLMFLKLNFVVATGLGACLTTMLNVLVNISLTPCLLVQFEGFFSKSVEPFSCCGRVFSRWSTQDNRASTKKSCWLTLGERAVTLKWGIVFVVIVTALTVPFAVFTANMQSTDNFIEAMPRGAAVTETFKESVELFGFGFTFPTNILVVPEGNSSIFSLKYFCQCERVVNNLVLATNDTALSDFAGYCFNGQFSCSQWHGLMMACREPSNRDLPICHGFDLQYSLFVNAAATATFLTFQPKFNPMSSVGHTWYQKALVASQNETVDFVGVAATSWSSIDVVMSLFPIIIAVTCVVVLLLVGITFKSLILPLISVISIAYSVAFVFGFADLTYNYGIFYWLNWGGLYQGTDALMWLVPVISFSIVVGLSLDYQIFLVESIQSFVKRGHSTRKAIVLGMNESSSLISIAGLIMAIAFSGLLFSSVGVLNQLAFYLVFSVLFDTFLVRPLLVPAVMSAVGELNWFPVRHRAAQYEAVN